MWRLALPAALAIGELCGFLCCEISSAWPAVAFVAVLVVLFGHGKNVPGWHYAAVFVAGIALAMHAARMRGVVLRDASEPGRIFEVALVVESVPPGGVGESRWTSFDSTFKGVDVRVIFKLDDNAPSPMVGEIWRCAGWLERKPVRDYRRRRLWIKGTGAFAARDPLSGKSALRMFFDAARRDLSRRIGIGLDKTEYSAFADINRALLLGERTRLPHETREVFADAGTLHIFAISGLHVAIMAKVVMSVLMLMFVPYRIAGLVALPILWCYVGMVGCGPSALRAAAMASLCMIAPLGMRRPDGLSAWTVTFVIFHLIWPESLVNVASLMSFTVMLGILLFAEWSKSFKSRSVEVAGVSLSAWAAGTPIVAHVFGRVSLGGILANFLLMPAMEFSVGAAFLGALLSYVSPMLAAHFNFAAALVSKAMVGISWAVSRVPGSCIETAPWTFWDCTAWYLVLGLSMWLARSIAVRRRNTI